MRNTTMLKHILQLYTIILDIDEEGIISLTVIHKQSQKDHNFSDKAYSSIIRKAYSHMLKELKSDEKSW
jgi:hypothetical protein